MAKSTKSQPISKYLVDLNKRELDKFFNLDKKTKVAISMSVVAILLFLAAGIYGPFRDQALRLIFTKEQSQATENARVSLEGSSQIKINEIASFEVRVISPATQFNYLSLNLSFQPENIEVISVDIKNSVISNFQSKDFNNLEGSIMLAGKTLIPINTSQRPLKVAEIKYKPKKLGETVIILDPSSQVLSAKDNKNILDLRYQPQLELQVTSNK